MSRQLLGAPSIFAGAPATWVKGQKCPSPFNIKAAQWLVRTSHCAFPKSSSSLKERFFFFLREKLLLPRFLLHRFISALPPLLLWPLHYRLQHLLLCRCCNFFLVVAASNSPVEVSESSSSCGACCSLSLDIVYCVLFCVLVCIGAACYTNLSSEISIENYCKNKCQS